jgi:hypothetical protein
MFKGPFTNVYKGSPTLCKNPFVHVQTLLVEYEKKCEKQTMFQANFQFESLRVSH